jgi:hypothetical protein
MCRHLSLLVERTPAAIAVLEEDKAINHITQKPFKSSHMVKAGLNLRLAQLHCTLAVCIWWL